MDVDRKIPWRHIAVEGGVIIASILLAFSIDAWWDDRLIHDAEQVVLQALLEDLREKEQLLAEMDRFSHTIVGSATTLLRVAAGAEEKPSEDTIDRLIGDTWWVSNEALWDSAPMNMLVTGGNLSLISSPTLVQELAALQVAIERVRNHYRSDSEFHQDVLTPFMIANANMGQISSRVTHRPGTAEDTLSFPDIGVSNDRDHGELLTSVPFQNLLVAKMERQLDILEVGHPGVEEHLVAVISMIENELQE
jgi:hypothetical protein